jgi:hypothetical protein
MVLDFGLEIKIRKVVANHHHSTDISKWRPSANPKRELQLPSYRSCWSAEENPLERLFSSADTFNESVPMGLQFARSMRVLLGRLVRYDHNLRTPGFRGCPWPSARVRINRRSAGTPCSRRVMPARLNLLRVTESRG